jgi:hypothetical protein
VANSLTHQHHHAKIAQLVVMALVVQPAVYVMRDLGVQLLQAHAQAAQQELHRPQLELHLSQPV